MENNVKAFKIDFDINGEKMIIDRLSSIEDVRIRFFAYGGEEYSLCIDEDDLATVGNALLSVSALIKRY